MPPKKRPQKDKRPAPPPEVVEEPPKVETPESLLQSTTLPNGPSLETVFSSTGIPVLQHKFQKALMGGSYGTKPRLLTLSADCARLSLAKREKKVVDLRASPQDYGKEDEKSLNISQIGSIIDGAVSTDLEASIKKREKDKAKIAAASARCLTLEWRSEFSAWDLELEPSAAATWGCSADELQTCLITYLQAVKALSSGGEEALAAENNTKAGVDEKSPDAVVTPPAVAPTLEFGFNYLCPERLENDGNGPKEIDLSKDSPNMPFATAFGAGFSCRGLEPTFSKAGFEVATKVNQDRGCMVYPYCQRDDMALFCAMDGHGKAGDKIAEYAIKVLPELLAAALMGKSKLNPEKALKKAYLDCDAGIRKFLAKDAAYSGTTAVCCLVMGKEIYTANVGDSRAVVCGVDPDNLDRVISKDLSTDHKPDVAAEKARIIQRGGWVSEESEGDGPARAWGDRNKTSAGLAVSRSLGDHVLGKVGVIAEPEVTHRNLLPYDKYLILGSDGIFEFVNSQAAATLVHKTMGYGEGAQDLDRGGPRAAETAIKKLLDVSNKAWKEKEGHYRDDTTVMVVRLPCFPKHVPGTQFNYPEGFPGQ